MISENLEIKLFLVVVFSSLFTQYTASDEMFDIERTLRSYGTVEYFCFVHTELTNQIEFLFFIFLSGITIRACTERFFGKSNMVSSSSVTTHSCNHAFVDQKLFTVMMFTPRPSKFSIVTAKNLTLILALKVLNGQTSKIFLR